MRRITFIMLAIIVTFIIIVLIYEIAGMILTLPVEYDQKIPTSNALGNIISLHEYRNASDQNWATVMRFLETDPTYQILYDYPNFVCSDFAKKLHDDAEKQGIRCGIVRINFTNYSFDPRWNTPRSGSLSTPVIEQTDSHNADHAVDVFNTTDRGLIYVDETNDGITGMIKIGYLEQGQEYNSLQLSKIDLSRSDCFNNSYYETIKNRYFNYINRINDYNDRVTDYNQQVSYYNSIGGAPGPIYDSLQNLGKSLEQDKVLLDTCEESTWKMTYPRGYVNQFYVYW
jgi:hypothetical protein